MSSSYQPRSNQRPENQESDVNIAELVGTAALAGVGLGGIAGLALKRKANTAKSTQQINEFLNKARQQRKSPGATSGVKQADLSNVDVTPSKTPTRMKEVYQEAAQPVEINKTPQLTGSTSVVRPNTFVDDYTREITERRLGEQQVEDALQVLNLTRESRSERARQAANVRRVQAAAADDIIDELRSQRTVDQTASAINSGAGQQTGRTKHRLQSNEDVVLRKVEQSEDLVDAALQKQVQQQNIPLENTPKRDAAIDLVSSGLPDGTPVDQAEIVATGQGSVQRKQVLENANLPSGSSSVSDLSTPNVAKKPALSEVDVDELKYWNSPAGKEELLDTSADLAFMDSDIGRKAAAREKIYDAQGIKYDYRNDIEAWKDNWKAQHTVDPETLKVVPKPAAIVKTGETIKVDPVDSQQFVAKQLSLFDPRPQSFELQDAVANFDSKVQQLMTGGGMSRARAEKIVLGDGKSTTSQGRQLKEQILQDLEENTALSAEDASNIAGSVINPITGQREVSSVQKVGAGYAVRGYVRKPFEQRSIPNVDPETNEALIKSPAGKAIKGRAPSYYEVPPKEQVRELPGPFKEEVPDRRTATRGGFGAALQKSIEEEGVQPAKMPEGGFAGVGIYGEDLKYVPGPAGTQAGKKPTDLPVSRTTGEEFNPLTQRERSGLKDMSNQGLKNIVARGTYKSGKVSGPAKAAQTELNIRANYTSPDFDPKKVSSTDVKTSLEASEEMRRARIEGRNPQEALKTFMKDKGLTGDFSLLSEKPANPTQPLPTKQATPEKQVKKGKTGSALGAFLNKNYYSVNKFPSV